MFTVTALPASYGDCLWIEYGDAQAPNVILIDAGPSAPPQLRVRLEQLAARRGMLELVVVTHVDADHIAGMLTLLEHNFYGVPVRDFWFNGLRHLPGESFGERQGEKLTELILKKAVPWNGQVSNGGLSVTDAECPAFDLPGGSRISLLSPDAGQLARLKKSWHDVCGEADLYEGVAAVSQPLEVEGRESFGAGNTIDALAETICREDNAVANGSSIAFILEYQGRRVLFGADAYPSRLLTSLTALLGAAPHQFDLVKLPHHGSENNVSKELIAALQCPRYLFSSNGAKFKHPAPQAVSRVIKYGNNPELLFNYRSEFNSVWDDALMRIQFPYKATYGGPDGITVKLD